MEIVRNGGPLDQKSTAAFTEFPDGQSSLPQSNIQKITILSVDALATASIAPELLQFERSATADLTTLTAASIISSMPPSAAVIRSRKSRRKIENSVAKTSDSSDLVIDISTDAFELVTDGAKKKDALQSVKQVQSLFKFIPPRGSCTSSDSNLSLKLCKGIRVEQLRSECTTGISNSIENNIAMNTTESFGDHCDGSITAMSKTKLHNFLYSDSHTLDNIREDVKFDKKKSITIIGDDPLIPSALLDYQLIRMNGTAQSFEDTTYRDSSVMNDNSVHSVKTHDDCNILSEIHKKSDEMSLRLDYPEKLKGKRKQNFHQPVSKKFPIVSRFDDVTEMGRKTEIAADNMDGNINIHAGKDLGMYLHGIKEEYHTQRTVFQKNTERENPMIADVEMEIEVVGSDVAVVCDSGSERGRVSCRNGNIKQQSDENLEIERQDLSPRASFSVDDNDNNTATAADKTTTKISKLEKKDSIKRLPKETKECWHSL